MKWILFSVALLATGVLLMREKVTAAVLRSELARQQRLAHEGLEPQRQRFYEIETVVLPTAGHVA